MGAAGERLPEWADLIAAQGARATNADSASLKTLLSGWEAADRNLHA